MKQTTRLASFVLALSCLVTTAMPLTASAASSSSRPASNTTTATTNPGTSSAAADKAKLKEVIKDSDTRINKRLKTLDELAKQVKDSPVFTNQINFEVVGLKALKTKIDTDTDLTVAKADHASIVTTYRVYKVMVPKITMGDAVDSQFKAQQKISTLADKMQTVLDTKHPATDVAAPIQAKLASVRHHITAARAQSDDVYNKLIAVTPANYNANNDVMKGYHAQVKAGQVELKAAMQDAKDAKALIKNL